ncbi:MAG: cytochrome c biogenesis protein CcsA [Bacteroidia bacterium]|nr:cytochrome c biogenesis protein CcsA [Bacteroidia bacterium]
MDFLSGGTIGELFAGLAFASALVATLAFFFAESRPAIEKRPWEKLALGGFFLHAAGVVGVVVTLFYLIYSHQYQYHYVWSHSSNELPVYYMISCFWEGQEGSFLLWSFWHSFLGIILIIGGGKWRNMVLGVISSVELIISSMTLGIYLNESIVLVVLVLTFLGPGIFLGYRYFKPTQGEIYKGKFHFIAFALGLAGLGLVISGQSGFYGDWSFSDLFAGGTGTLLGIAFLIVAGLLLALLISFITNLWGNQAGSRHLSGLEILAGMFTGALTLGVLLAETGAWKIGSSPFILLKDANPNAPIFTMNPDFVPANGSGLNPLLQNYWMVIHPPTLFLGFASTVVPFAFVISGLIKRQYHEWIRPATPWTIFSVCFLGIGIIMGGYWAYETLNFGGYWNWDPVENASLVPWLIGIASIHGMLAYRKSKTFLRLTMVLVIFTFLLVLYSTFLTRSGILGDTSVHSFTDLGLAGQLLVLLLVYFVSVFFLFLERWKDIPDSRTSISFWSKEFFLFLGTLIFIFSGLGITISTSIPVINKILGTSLAPPLEVTFFYFRWNVWFAILMGVFSGIGQFLFWTKVEKEALGKAIFRPFLLAMLSASVIIVAIAVARMDFAFNSDYREWLEVAGLSDSLVKKLSKYLQFGLYIFSDELLLASSLFTIFANLDIMIRIVRKNWKSMKVLGGSLAHIGFGLMLVGVLFSSGFDSIVSKNLTPNELAFFEEDDRRDNVLLQKNKPRLINGYLATYIGKSEAEAPISDLRILEEDENSFKLSFEDKKSETFALVLPKMDFLDIKDGKPEIDLEYTREYLEEVLDFVRPDHINKRNLYGIDFIETFDQDDQVRLDTARRFTLYPETEVNTSNNSILPHPSRKIFAGRDLYVHITTIPSNEDFQPQFLRRSFGMALGDTVKVGSMQLRLKEVVPEDSTRRYELIARAVIEVDTGGKTFRVEPRYRISRNGIPRAGNVYLKELSMVVQFAGIDPQRGLMLINVQQQMTFPEDYVVMNAIHKPYINVLWLGTFVLVAGFGLAFYRRWKER